MYDFPTIPTILRAASEIMLSADRPENATHAKSGAQNFVTDYDIRTEQFLRVSFAKALPDWDMLGEESADTHPGKIAGGRTLIVDPIDGTTNFMENCRYSAISVGACDRGTMVYGAVYNPYADELFYAVRGGGAYLVRDGAEKRIHVSTRALSDGLCLFGTSPYYRDRLGKATFASLWSLFQCCRDIRRSGSAALDLCAIAAGRGDVFFEYLLSPWDYAAGSLIIEEAGGVIGTFDGSPLAFDHPCPVLAGNPETVAEVLQKDILRQNAGNAIYD